MCLQGRHLAPAYWTAEPDVQALIAERVEAGEIFTAAKVKEIRKEAKGVIAELPFQAAVRKADANRNTASANLGLCRHH